MSSSIGTQRRSVSLCDFDWCHIETSPKEGGLLGSQAVAQDYEKKGVNVIAMSQVGSILRDASAALLNFISSST